MTDLIPALEKLTPTVVTRLAPFMAKPSYGELSPVLTVAKERGQTKVGKVLDSIGIYGAPIWIGSTIGGPTLSVSSLILGPGGLSTSLIAGLVALIGGGAGATLMFRGSYRNDKVEGFLLDESRKRLETFLRERFGIKLEKHHVYHLETRGVKHDVDIARMLLKGAELRVTDKSGVAFCITATRKGDHWTYTAVDPQGRPPLLDAAGSVVNPDVPSKLKAKKKAAPAVNPLAILSQDGLHSWKLAADLLLSLPTELSVEQAHVVNRARASLAEIRTLAGRLVSLGSADPEAIESLSQALRGVLADLEQVAAREAQSTRHEAQILARYVEAARR